MTFYNGENKFPLQMKLCETNSGYVRLKVINEERFMSSPLILQNVFVNDNREYYLANLITATVRNGYMTCLSDELIIPGVLTDCIITGPSIAYVTTGGFNPGTFAIDKIDTVISIPCAKWPTVAEEWIYRKRDHNWPPSDFISEHVKRGCYVVPVGCKECSRQHLDWRLSFVLVEQALVLDFNPTQFQCLLLLKQLKKFNLETEIGDIISSYILKTVVFWVIEESPPALWVPHRLLTVVHLCLDRVIECVQSDFCPNYFIRTCNLLAKRYNEIEKQSVLRICRSVRTNTSGLLRKSPPFKEIIQTLSKDMLSVISVLRNSIIDTQAQRFPSLLAWRFKIGLGDSLRSILSCQESLQTAIEHCCKGPEKLRRACRMKDVPMEEVADACTEMELIRRRLLWTKDILNEERKANIMCIEVSQSRLRETDALMENITICHMNVVAGNFHLCSDMIKSIISTAKTLPNFRVHFPPANCFLDGQNFAGIMEGMISSSVFFC
ncbi:cyclic GMP-AMP synthase-like receptor [Argopecten irradians]|uniref:cyclic GMP-AMP synthase-like receptor n=1 Tax=Argopecten irradians TaxID=31199 RepID=UPI0037182686